MVISQANALTRVIPDAVATVLVDANKTYTITPQVFKRNMVIGMIAIPSDFPGNRSYAHQTFTAGEPAFSWKPLVDGVAYNRVHFYALLPWDQQSAAPGIHETVYDIGRGDGEQHDLLRQQVSTLTVTMKDNATGGHRFHDTPNTSVTLPANLIEMVPGHHIKVESVRASNGEALTWAHVQVLYENSKAHIEKSIRIQVISGTVGQTIIGYIDPNFQGPHVIPLGPVGNPAGQMYLNALVSPTVNPADPNDFTFEVGDPEKDGKVTIRSI